MSEIQKVSRTMVVARTLTIVGGSLMGAGVLVGAFGFVRMLSGRIQEWIARGGIGVTSNALWEHRVFASFMVGFFLFGLGMTILAEQRRKL